MNVNTGKIKKILKSAWEAQKQLEADIDELQRMHDIALRITPLYSLSPGGGNGNDRQQNAITEIVLIENDIRADIEKLRIKRQKVYSLIKKLDDDVLRVLLIQRYMQYKKWEDIAADLNYSWMHVHRLHSKALVMLQKYLKML